MNFASGWLAFALLGQSWAAGTRKQGGESLSCRINPSEMLRDGGWQCHNFPHTPVRECLGESRVSKCLFLASERPWFHPCAPNKGQCLKILEKCISWMTGSICQVSHAWPPQQSGVLAEPLPQSLSGSCKAEPGRVGSIIFKVENCALPTHLPVVL